MRVLIVCRSRGKNIAQFIEEQAECLKLNGLAVDYFLIQQEGVLGYVKSLKLYHSKIEAFEPDVIHAHYGISGLFANLQRKIPVVTTYLGSDINYKKVYYLSKLSMFLSAHNIFVSNKNLSTSKLKKKYSMIPFGVKIELFKPAEKSTARIALGLPLDKKLVLFAGKFQNRVKNAALAQSAVAKIDGLELLPLGGYTRKEVVALFNAVDVAILTSFTEGSPQFIKEAMACNCPIVSTDVGDVAEVFGHTKGCYLTSFEVVDVEAKLREALAFNKRTSGQNMILKYDNNLISNAIIEVYNTVLRK